MTDPAPRTATASAAERRRPLRVCYPFIGNNVGGSHISTLMLVRQLDRGRVEPVVVLHEAGPLADYVREQGLTYELIDIPAFFKPPYWSLRNILSLIRKTATIARFIRHHDIDLVHANDVRIHFGWTLAIRLAGAKLVWHQRTGSFGRSTIKLLLALLSHKVVCISRYTASTLPRSLGRLIRIIANPFETGYATVDRGAEREKIRRQLALPQETQIIGFFGNLVQQKRPFIFLRAAAEIAKSHSGPFAFLLFGAERNNAIAELTAMAGELGIEGQLYFMGFQTPVEPWMAGCDLIIAPGIGEGLGRTLVEAMIVGTPVVAADSGGHRDVITDGQNGLLARADDPEAFAAASGRLLSDRDLAARLACRAKQEAVENYSIKHHVREMTEIYAGCLDGSRKTKSQDGAPDERSFTEGSKAGPR